MIPNTQITKEVQRIIGNIKTLLTSLTIKVKFSLNNQTAIDKNIAQKIGRIVVLSRDTIVYQMTKNIVQNRKLINKISYHIIHTSHRFLKGNVETAAQKNLPFPSLT